MKDKILVIDIETTNFLPKGGSIVEVGAVELNIETGETKILLDSVCREKILSAKHRDRSKGFGWIFDNSDLTEDDVRTAPPFEEVAEKLQAIIDKYPWGVTAFNRNFDIPFLEDRGIKFGKLQPCPMLVLTPIMKLPHKNGRSGDKWPSCEEAWQFCFPDVEYVEKHRGADDAKHEAMIVFECIQRKFYTVSID